MSDTSGENVYQRFFWLAAATALSLLVIGAQSVITQRTKLDAVVEKIGEISAQLTTLNPGAVQVMLADQVRINQEQARELSDLRAEVVRLKAQAQSKP
jgi:heme exporter protein D